MDIRNLKAAAKNSLAGAAYDPKKIILIHAGASAAVMLVLTAINFFLQNGIDATGGLSGMGMRSVLSTASTVLQLAANICMPFWNAGYVLVTLLWVRGENARPEMLLGGFRQWGGVLRLMLCRQFLYLGVGIVCGYVAAGIFTATPYAQPMMELLMPAVSADPYADPYVLLESVDADALLDTMMPMMVIFLIVYILALLPFVYRLRFADLALMDDPQAGAFSALRKSIRLTRGNTWSLVRMDLSYWWYFLALLAVTVVGYGDVLLTVFGVTLPVSADAAFFLFYAAYAALHVALAYAAKNRVETTYAHAYTALLTAPEPEAPQTPKNVPWTY